MHGANGLLNELRDVSASEASLFFLLSNVAIFIVSVTMCHALGRLFQSRRIFDRYEPLRAKEIAAALGAVFLNAAVSMLGWGLWKTGAIVITEGSFARGVAHAATMILFMDFGMYWFHRLAHHPLFYKRLHSFHHRHEVTNPISLFVLHPAEVFGFGMLMIAYLTVFPTSLSGLIAYLTLNVLWGTLGHSGVEPFPARFAELPLLRLCGTSTFHAGHHEHISYNFGFYTLIWDRLFGTLDPDYTKRFGRDASPN